MERIKSIDVFRGLSIILMVLFTLMNILSPKTFFAHNIQGEIHPGDFVLPLFLFSSGMSLVFFVEKRKGKSGTGYFLDVVERFGMLFGLGMLLSPITTGTVFGMDELALSAILFVLSLLLIGFPWIVQLFASLLLAIVYLAITTLGMQTMFDGVHIGGYQGAVFYLPVMLAGAALGKGISLDEGAYWKRAQNLFLLSLVLFALLVLVFPLDKTRVTPSFMALSIAVAIAFYAGVNYLVEGRKMSFQLLEYIGKRPIRYWVSMIVLFGVPYSICIATGACASPSDLPVSTSLVVCGLFMVFFVAVSRVVDEIKKSLS